VREPDFQDSTLPRVRIRNRSWALWAILIAIVICVVEAGAAVSTQLLLRSSARYFLWKPDLDLVRSSWNDSIIGDEEIGWPPPGDTTSGTRDTSGAKYNANFPDPADACASAYGDSFVWGDDVPLPDGWVEQLSHILGCRVSNFGVSGYGTDQAYLRFRRLNRTNADTAPTAILGIFPDDIVRSVNQYRAFIGFGTEPFWIKGRFILDGAEGLQWIDRPHLDANTYLNLHRDPARYLPHEYLLPDTRDGPVSVRFPYTLTLARLALARPIWTRVRGRTPLSEFYSPTHPSGAVPLTIAIAAAFAREAAEHGKQTFIMMLPSAGSFRELTDFGEPDYAPFVAAMVANGMDAFDPAPALLAALNGRSYCEIYADPTGCQGHFGVAGGGLLAKIVATELRRRKLTK
jgi:hypothetical protein